MKKSLRAFCLIVLFSLLGCFGLTGCSLTPLDWDINDGFDDEDYVAPDYEFSISADMETITFNISNVGEYGDNATLAALPIHQYLYSEEINGLAEETSASAIELETYECGTTKTFNIDRYFDKNDGIYYKYYILDSNDDILAGPMFCNNIEPLYKHDEPIVTDSIKGVMCENLYTDMVADLGCSYTELNFWLDNVFVPNEIYENGKIKEIVYSEGVSENGNMTITRDEQIEPEEVVYMDYNGQRYYFRFDTISYYDGLISWYTHQNVKVTLIMLLKNVADKYKQPYFLTYPSTASASTYVQVNTSNKYGAGYWAAFMEFMGQRYSQSADAKTSKYGLVQTYVIGNEIDHAGNWNNIVGSGQAALLLEDYVEEYERAMRIANQALKKYYSSNKVLVSFTHDWAKTKYEYTPKAIIDYMTNKTNRQGNYDYGFAMHPYGFTLSNPAFWQGDTSAGGMNGSLNTSAITWSNLEVLQLYLEQPSKLCNGEIRSVYLTEGGVASATQGKPQYELTKNQQAAGVAYAYYKASHLSCIKALIYYRLVDHPGDGTYFGLVCDPEGLIKKQSYYVYKYIDTQYSFEASYPYLKYVTWSVSNGWGTISYGQDVGNVRSFKDTMALFPSRFDWNTNWNEELIIRRIITEDFEI